jgi:hypothetical protein
LVNGIIPTPTTWTSRFIASLRRAVSRRLEPPRGAANVESVGVS